MKLENALSDKPRMMAENYRRAVTARATLHAILSSNKYAVSDGGVAPAGKKALYSLCLTENEDGSGPLHVDLTGLGLNMDIYKAVMDMLDVRISQMQAEIAAL